MFRNLLLVGLLAGVLAGSLLSALQYFTVIPLIQQAEVYEHQSVELPTQRDAHEPGASLAEWEPEEGLERLGFTWLANLAIATGFSLMMAGLMALHPPRRLAQALVYGLAGFYAFFIAPVLLLPPELPGADSPHLQTRQATWLLTVGASLAGLGLLAFAKARWLRLLGLLVTTSPFLLFTRFSPHYLASLPEDLIQRFAVMSGLSNLVLWLVIGMGVYWLPGKLIGAGRHSLSRGFR